MTIAPSTAVAADGLLASLDPEQREAATLPDGPAQIIAPAGSGKTTTLIARLGVLLGRGVLRYPSGLPNCRLQSVTRGRMSITDEWGPNADLMATRVASVGSCRSLIGGMT